MAFPEGCHDRECNYFVRIQRDEQDHNLLLFKLEGNAQGWIAVGFSPTPNMVCNPQLLLLRVALVSRA